MTVARWIRRLRLDADAIVDALERAGEPLPAYDLAHATAIPYRRVWGPIRVAKTRGRIEAVHGDVVTGHGNRRRELLRYRLTEQESTQ